MIAIGTVESLWRYPVKSMRGEELPEVFAGFGGIAGDRLFAFKSSANREEFPYFTARDQHEMLRYRASLRRSGESSDWMVDVQTVNGEILAINDPALLQKLRQGVEGKHELSLMQSEHALADAYPLSLFSVQTAAKLGHECGMIWDKRRFRANVYLDIPASNGFAEDEFVGRTLRLGHDVMVAIVKKDGRCMMVTLDPDTGMKSPALLKQIAQAHNGTAGVYARVVAEGLLRKGDAVELLD